MTRLCAAMVYDGHHSCPITPHINVLANTNLLFYNANNCDNQMNKAQMKQESRCGPTPPCSPDYPENPDDAADDEDSEHLSGDDNLVLLSMHTRDPSHPEFEEKYDKVRTILYLL